MKSPGCFNCSSRSAFQRAKDKPDWTPEWKPPEKPAAGKFLCRGDAAREVSIRDFLARELAMSKTAVERQLLAGLLDDVTGTLRLIG